MLSMVWAPRYCIGLLVFFFQLLVVQNVISVMVILDRSAAA